MSLSLLKNVLLTSKTNHSSCLVQLLRHFASTGGQESAAPVKLLVPADYEILVTPENREHCLEKLRNLPEFPRPKSMTSNKHEKKIASVLVALCQDRDTNELSLLYTRRSRHLRRHGYQVSFPGGQLDEQDKSFVDCALRETEEEIGLPRQRIEVWGEGKQIFLPRTSAIVPVVGHIQNFHISELHLNLDEVEEAFSIPLNSLMASTATRHTQFRAGYSGPVFMVDNNRIWGITGYLTQVFLHCLLPKNMLPVSLKTNIKFIRPYKLPPKQAHPHHHHQSDSKN
ncbi:uncharacterized protein Dwil_GK10080 [Drosophila willistoni]|uniref:Nudix hydrolase domain-containing protein n=1 Tax=Drosophila willistoni TaxID=7260 RepID=B4NCP6_DROWI|nr:mitochondrial coenzyme A diphosphatase NUDT8 [Drosophila willistoni]EDW82605.1 uncharacterized protein Dwil_GK10080 [Drosophila willistoni]